MFITWTFSEKSGLGDVGASFLWIYIKNLEALQKFPFLGTLSNNYKVYKNYIDLYKKLYKYQYITLLKIIKSHIMEKKTQNLLKCKTWSNKKSKTKQYFNTWNNSRTSRKFPNKEKKPTRPSKNTWKQEKLNFLH